MRRLVPALLAVALLGCGSDKPSPASSGDATLADLTITVDADGDGGAPPKEMKLKLQGADRQRRVRRRGRASPPRTSLRRRTTRRARRSTAAPRPRRSRARSAATRWTRRSRAPTAARSSAGRRSSRCWPRCSELPGRRQAGPRFERDQARVARRGDDRWSEGARAGQARAAAVDVFGKRYEPEQRVVARIEVKGPAAKGGRRHPRRRADRGLDGRVRAAADRRRRAVRRAALELTA